MATAPDQQARQALLTLADLSPSAADDDDVKGSIPLEWFRWMPASSVSLFAWMQSSELHMRDLASPAIAHRVRIDPELGDRLAAVDQIRADQRSLRVGWLFVAGRTTSERGRTQRIFQPLVSMPVRVQRDHRGAELTPAGDMALSPLIRDPTIRAQLEARGEFGEQELAMVSSPRISADQLRMLPLVRSWASSAAAGMGLTIDELVPVDRTPEDLLRAKGLVIVVGVGVYATTDVGGLSHSSSLVGWAAEPLKRATAFHALYVDVASSGTDTHTDTDELTGSGADDDDPVMTALKPVSPFVLTPAQRKAVVRSRSWPITVVSGAPGTGKSHTIAAIACDALGRGETALVAAKSDATIDALVDLFERAPGLDPIVFGSSERKDALAARLAGGRAQVVRSGSLEHERDQLAGIVATRDAMYARIAAQLRAERATTEDVDDVTRARVAWPLLFDSSLDLDHVGELIAVASHAGGGWLTQWRQRRATEALDELTGAATAAQRRDVVRAYVLARATLASDELLSMGGLDIGRAWDDLRVADDRVRVAAAAWLAAESRSEERLDRTTLAAVGALATALRSGRAARRQQLASVDVQLTRALPLWVGTLADIEDLLPRSSAMFDVVILDEASSIDQPLAASALLRGGRGVVVGDPRQLRHVSFLSDEQKAKAFAKNGVAEATPMAGKLDVRRNSTFDVAASVAPVLMLDEHFRCAPHLVDFVSRRLYDGSVHVATRSPATESVDCVDVIRLDGTRNEDEVVEVEVRTIIDLLRRLREHGATSVGVITPFRAQASALEAAVLAAFGADDLEAMDVRMGTVHAFQGNERDVVIASMGIGTNSKPGSWRFAQDPHLFTVLVTRARQRFIVVYTGDPPEDGLFAQYLAQANEPPRPPKPATALSRWPTDIANDLEQAGIAATLAYPTGRHVIDLCVRGDGGFFGLACGVHPDGADAHIERHLSLTRAGWDVREAFRSRWADRRGELLVELMRTAGVVSPR